jgi:hypothetical protein
MFRHLYNNRNNSKSKNYLSQQQQQQQQKVKIKNNNNNNNKIDTLKETNTINDEGDLVLINKYIKDIFSNIRFVYRRNSSQFVDYILKLFKTMNSKLIEIESKRLKNKEKNKIRTFLETEDNILNLKKRPDKLKHHEIVIINDFVSRINNNRSIDYLKYENLVNNPKNLTKTNIAKDTLNNIELEENKKNNEKEKENEFIKLLNKKQKLYEFEDLKYIGVSEKGIHLLRISYSQFLNGEQNRSIILILQRLKSKDYELIYYFFHKLKEHLSIGIVQTDYNIRKEQEKSLKRKYNIKDNEEIPDASRAICFSNCCKNIKTFTAQNEGIKYYGQQKIIYNLLSQSYVCNGKKSKNKKKNLKNNSSLKIPTIKERKKKRAKQTKSRYDDRCDETPVVIIPGPGHIIKYDHGKEKSSTKSYTICPKHGCGSVTEFSMAYFGPNGFSCGVCDEDEKEQFNVPHCSGGCKTIRKSIKNWSVISMLDDGNNGTDVIRKYHFCPTCSRKCMIQKTDSYYDQPQMITFQETKAMLGEPIKTNAEYETALWQSWPGINYLRNFINNYK